MNPPELKIPVQLWTRLIAELRMRGRGCRESGAFLLGRNGIVWATDFVCFDDLDPAVLDSGIITFHGCGFVNLWNLCRERSLSVVADVHTHPSEWTGQSFSDRTNPMINQSGHVALIVPSFAQELRQTLDGVGIYEYRGHHRWKRWKSTDQRVQLCAA